MPPKKRRRDTTPEKENAIYNFLANLELTRICPEKFFEIIFIAEADEETNEIMREIINASIIYEEISCATFITHDEVINMLENFSESAVPMIVKLYLEDIIQETKQEFIKNQNLQLNKLAQLIKLKLFEVMYQHYEKKINRMERRKCLENELQNLSIYTKKSEGLKKTDVKDEVKKPMSPSINVDTKRSKPKICEKSVIESTIFETINLSKLDGDNKIVFDDDISSQRWFYIFHGFYDPFLLKELISNHKIPISAIIRIEYTSSSTNHKCETGENKSNHYKTFWKEVSNYFDGPERSNSFENSILMKYNISGSNYVEIFEGLLNILKRISDIKYKHLNYIRHMKTYRFQNINEMLPVDCLNTYNRLLSHIPTELVDEHVILSSLLEEIDSRSVNINVLERFNIEKEKPQQPVKFIECTNPLHLNEHSRSSRNYRDKFFPKRLTSYIVHENDINQILLKEYRNCGALVVELLTNVWKNAFPFNILKKIERTFHDICHKHDIDPSTRKKQVETDIMEHFLYLCLFSALIDTSSSEVLSYSNSAEYLSTYNRIEFENMLKPGIVNDGSECDISTNLYDPSPMKYLWKEQLSSEILSQELLRAKQTYLYIDSKYSPETDDLLIQLSDNLGGFGTNTKFFEEAVVTPVCLRDFCKYVLVEQSKWLEENTSLKNNSKGEFGENCEGVELMKNLDLYKDYRYLLNSKMILEEDMDKCTKVEEMSPSESIREQIRIDPTNGNGMNEPSESVNNKQFLGYDLGTKYHCVRGARTTFCSHDNVKIVVENTGMIDNESRCSVNLTCMGNILTLHSKILSDYTFHCTLKNKTVITFILQDHMKKTKPNISPRIEVSSETNEEPGIDDTEMGISIFNNANIKVITVNMDDFTKNSNYSTPHNINSFEPNVFNNLKDAIDGNYSVYKVGNNMKFLRRLENRSEIPLSGILRRFIDEVAQKPSSEAFSKRFVNTNDTKSNLAVEKTVDFRICLPNGLYISCYPSQINDNLVELKQEYIYLPLVNNEEFRLFTREGTVLIKKTDGTITLLKSNGDIITFEKPDSENDRIRQSNLKTCHCKNINDYRKKITEIIKDSTQSRRYSSRRACFQTKKGYIIREDLSQVLENMQVPYLRRMLLRFDGTKTTLEKNHITQKKLFYTTCEQDFLAEEIYFEREDGLRIILDKMGTQIVKFPDGTKISSTVYESKEMMDGYVYISLLFSYEHLYYATVSYNPNDDLKVYLDNDVCLSRHANDTLTLKIGTDVSTEISDKKVEFDKHCNVCGSNYICSFNISPFMNKKFDPTSQFLHAQDSYNKHFYSDYEGNCKRNTSFLNGPHNAFGCNHYKNNIYKKLFVINRTSGVQFWSKSMIDSKKRNESDSIIEKIKMKRKHLHFIQFKKHYSESYAERYLNKTITGENVCLTKYKQVQKKELLYTTIRVIKKVLDSKKADALLSNFRNCSIEDFDISSIALTNAFLKDIIENNGNMSTEKTETHDVTKPPEKEKKCKCHQIKLTFLGKVARWKEECDRFRKMIKDPVPVYFESQFCQIIE
nr:uncharacterized protein LOC111516271 [Leptinotarsa decemlineata]